MTGAELKQFRHELSDELGRRLSFSDMAKVCGLAPRSGADTWRKWEASGGPSGPVAVLMTLLVSGCYHNSGWFMRDFILRRRLGEEQ